ncbi:MAG TPA: sugar phosphate isomerase/epimerase family protein [Candidatus Bathyarchaeia archaeon]|nr:sugar phosphate isomerase/epimerase family protein [Candidatus Bathyarchaeia archaeon]
MVKVGMVLMVLLLGGAAVAEPWPLGVRIMSYGKYQDAAWAHLQKIGVKHVFVSVPAADEADGVMAKLKEHGLDTPVVRGQADLSKDTFAAELEPQLAVAEKMGAKYMFISAKRGESPKEDAYRRLREAGEAAKKHGVIITMETHPDLGTNGAVQVETMTAIDHPNVRVNFDTANITYYNENTSAQEELAKSVAYVATVEFKDHSGLAETWDFPVVGKGMVDFRALIDLLKQNGYRGPFTIEFEGTKGVALDEAQTLTAIADSVAYTRTLAEFD